MTNCREQLSLAHLGRQIVGQPERCVPSVARRGLSPADRIDGFAEDLDRPLLVGYIRRELLVVDAQVALAQRQMALYAAVSGFSMSYIYIEEAGTWPAAFDALVEAVIRLGITAVMLPSLLHFAVLGPPCDIKGSFERATGARVLLLASP
ncbi:hypothetical protein [Kribbella sp. CA-293567]|uniref:hypothetical protein n=1 Tax=Kribbella sp. CA-293567 TaxID=3002436 RepID=UPI0022DD4E51|nr:hypothetical protein [Kribbella sp. CA-293567]WBQ04348.1 hypothetical protein OX958_30830 [Kribbella sp. CA-293567]